MNWFTEKLMRPRTKNVASGEPDGRYANDAVRNMYKIVNDDTLETAINQHIDYCRSIGFKSKDSEIKGDPHQIIYKMAMREHTFKPNRSILMGINLHERAQWLRQLGSTKEHSPGENKFYATELAVILEEAVKFWGPSDSTTILDIKKVKSDLEQMSFERSIKLYQDNLNARSTSRFEAAKKYIEKVYVNDSKKRDEEIARLRELNRYKGDYSMSAIDGLHLCGDETGAQWRAYTGQKPRF